VNPARKKEHDAATEYDLFLFLGEDALAMRITGALLRDRYLRIRSVEALRAEWAKPDHGQLLDVNQIGGKSVDRIAEKTGIPW
jgi:hypothetical protein